MELGLDRFLTNEQLQKALDMMSRININNADNVMQSLEACVTVLVKF